MRYVRKTILFIGGSLNQTTMMHKISQHFEDCDCYFTPYYSTGMIGHLVRMGLLSNTILGGRFRQLTERYLKQHNLKVDYKGRQHDYDLVFTSQDLIIPSNIRNKRIALVQEGMTEPETLIYHLVKLFSLPRWMGSTAMTGLSDRYDLFFVASEGYRDLLFQKGSTPKRYGLPEFRISIMRRNISKTIFRISTIYWLPPPIEGKPLMQKIEKNSFNGYSPSPVDGR